MAVQLDLKKHRELWEDIEGVLVSCSRRTEKGIPLETVKAGLIKAASSPGELSDSIGSAKKVRGLVGKRSDCSWPIRMINPHLHRAEYLEKDKKP